ncbi:MAG: GGDEF domain-containing protein [Ruminococcaceae bacterium]|nr:GGDEF domain-containing protein [Oscillospiraceae bacterium]
MKRRNVFKVNKVFVGVILVVAIILLLTIEYLILSSVSRAQAYQTATMLNDQVKTVLSNNERKELALTDSLKEDYIARAKAVSYIVDRIPRTEDDIVELMRIASLLSIDEIHLFDTSGTIYAGTVPAYYGYSFDSGEQMAYFKPMLYEKTLAMCQDVTPNTAEGKAMMYAICWNDAGTRMTQIGIEPVRLIEELRANEVSEVVADMPAYIGTKILVAELDTGEIVGATSPQLLGKPLSDIGVKTDKLELPGTRRFTAKVDGDASYCVASDYGDYVIVIAQVRSVANRSIPSTMATVFLYLLLAVAAIMLVVRQMTVQVIEEHRNANTDQMTGFFNRRAYEDDMAEQEKSPLHKNFIYVSADLNGLKTANDNFGHDAGDELIRGAAQCMKRSFSKYGRLYRIGGDEFAAMIHADDKQLDHIKRDFARWMDAWSEQHQRRLAISCGYVRSTEFPDKTSAELAKIADTRMYQAKDEYYRTSGLDRRRR